MEVEIGDSGFVLNIEMMDFADGLDVKMTPRFLA